MSGFRSIFIVSSITASTLVLPASGEEKTSSYKGYLLDKQCSDSVRDDSNADDFAKAHTRDCGLMDNCQRKGYCLYVKPNWYDLDKQNTKLAIKVLKDTKKGSGIYVLVEGKVQDGKLKVKKMTEIDEPSERTETKDGK